MGLGAAWPFGDNWDLVSLAVTRVSLFFVLSHSGQRPVMTGTLAGQTRRFFLFLVSHMEGTLPAQRHGTVSSLFFLLVQMANHALI